MASVEEAQESDSRVAEGREGISLALMPAPVAGIHVSTVTMVSAGFAVVVAAAFVEPARMGKCGGGDKRCEKTCEQRFHFHPPGMPFGIRHCATTGSTSRSCLSAMHITQRNPQG